MSTPAEHGDTPDLTEQIAGWLAEHAFLEGLWRCRCGWKPSASRWGNAIAEHRPHVAAVLADHLSARSAATPDTAALARVKVLADGPHVLINDCGMTVHWVDPQELRAALDPGTRDQADQGGRA